MNDFKHLYQETFSHVKASPALRKELLSMTEKTRKPKKFVLRKLLVAAAVLALAFALAMGANAATNGALFEFIGMISVEVDGKSYDAALYRSPSNDSYDAILGHRASESGLDTYVITPKGNSGDTIEWDWKDSSGTEKTYVGTDDDGVSYVVEDETEVPSAPEA